MGTFAEDTRVEPAGGGRYAAVLDHSWDVVTLPQGGVLAAYALRAAASELDDPAMPLRTCTTVFAGQVEAGELDIEVRVLRKGRSASQLLAEVKNRDRTAGATTLAVFGGPRRGPSFVDVAMPVVPPPRQCRSYRDPVPEGVEEMPPSPFWSRLEGRGALGHPRWEEHEAISSECASWYRFDDPPVGADGSLDPLAVVALADRMPGSISERLGHVDDDWFAPSVDLTVHLFAPARSEWVLAHDRARWAGDGWASAETTLWDEQANLVAYATQLMLFSYPS